jgi:anhydro-N-acetylmuramic acid kinase
MIVHNRKDKLEIIGLMSGSSLDGLDIAYTSFEFQDNEVKFELLNCETIPYDSELLTEINKYYVNQTRTLLNNIFRLLL